MRAAPRYDGEPVIAVDVAVADSAGMVMGQRRRLEASLGKLATSEWSAQSRCAEWTVRDVVTHLVDVNQFWATSIEHGLRGEPTHWLAAFDPAVTPAQLVAQHRDWTTREVRQRFAESNDRLADAMDQVAGDQWSWRAEAPVGHVALFLVASHALWDGWIHERDIWLPRGVTPPEDDEEITTSLRYVAALSGAFNVLSGPAPALTLALVATAPDLSLVVETSTCATVRDTVAPPGLPTLSGRAVTLLEALSLRAPLPPAAPVEWRAFLNGLAAVFAASPAE